MPLKDPDARREYHRKYIKERLHTDPIAKAKHASLVRGNNRKNKESCREAIAIFRAQGCCVCDEKEYCCMDAHHTDPAAKDFSIGDAIRLRLSKSRIEQELKKCICVCRNCHAKIHAGLVKVV